MNITHYIHHPEQLDKSTLHELRTIVAAHPTYQAARLLMLHNLYLLHDSTFDEELRRAAVYITDRNVIFNLVEAVHHQLTPASTAATSPKTAAQTSPSATQQKTTAAMAAHDYLSYLLNVAPPAGKTPAEDRPTQPTDDTDTAANRQQQLIDDFIRQAATAPQTLSAEPETESETTPQQDPEDGNGDEGFFTETLARIYIKQGRYDKALQIIRRLNLNYPEKSRYFADQIRFLEKLIINQQH